MLVSTRRNYPKHITVIADCLVSTLQHTLTPRPRNTAPGAGPPGLSSPCRVLKGHETTAIGDMSPLGVDEGGVSVAPSHARWRTNCFTKMLVDCETGASSD